MVKRKTTEEFKQEVAKQGLHEYEVLSNYVNNKTKVTFKHLVCGHTFSMTPSNFLRGHQCPWCAGNQKKTTEQFKQEVTKQSNHEYEVLSDYVNSKTKVTFKHLVCGNIFQMTPNHFLRGSRCPICANNLVALKQRKSSKQFKQEVAEQGHYEYEVLSDYINNHTKVTFKHLVC